MDSVQHSPSRLQFPDISRMTITRNKNERSSYKQQDSSKKDSKGFGKLRETYKPKLRVFNITPRKDAVKLLPNIDKSGNKTQPKRTMKIVQLDTEYDTTAKQVTDESQRRNLDNTEMETEKIIWIEDWVRMTNSALGFNSEPSYRESALLVVSDN